MRQGLALIVIASVVLAGCSLRRGSEEAPTLAPAETVVAASTTRQPVSSPAAPTAAPSPTAAPTATTAAKVFVKITNTEGQGAYVRSGPSTSSPGTVWPEGTILEVVGDDKPGENGTWKNVKAPDGTVGYTFAAYLTVAQGATAVATAPVPAAPPTPAPAATPAAAAPTAAPAPAAGKLELVAVVDNAVISGSEQTLRVKLTRGGQGVQGASVTFSAHYRGQSRNYTMPATNANGASSLTFNVEGAHGPVRVEVTATTPQGETASASTGFEVR